MKKLIILLLLFTFTVPGFCFLGFGKSEYNKMREKIIDEFEKIKVASSSKSQASLLFNQNFSQEIMFVITMQKSMAELAMKQEPDSIPAFFRDALSEYIEEAKNDVRSVIATKPDEIEIINKEYKVTDLLQWLNDFQYYTYLKMQNNLEKWKKDKKTCFELPYENANTPCYQPENNS